MAKKLKEARRLSLPDELPARKDFVPGMRRAPDRGLSLSPAQVKVALKNALRYVPSRCHEEIAPEFMDELLHRGRIYGYRYRPAGSLKAKAIDAYPGKILEAKAFQVMIDNNLDFDVALYPYELVTYGESGQVFQNWMQYSLVKLYLSEMTDRQTLVVYSGHPLGLFESRPDAPRVISTKGAACTRFGSGCPPPQSGSGVPFSTVPGSAPSIRSRICVA